MRPPRALVLAAVLTIGAATPARGADPEPASERAEAQLFGAAINRYLEKKLPVTIELPGDRAAGVRRMTVTLAEARFCGALDGTRGRAIAVVRAPAEPALPTPVSSTPLLGRTQDCQDKLEDIAQRRGPTDAAPLGVIEVIAGWAPWELRLSLGGAATSGNGAEALGAALARAKAAGPLTTVETSGLRLANERGGALILDLALAFVKTGDAVLATFTPAGRSSRPEARASMLDPAAAPAGSDGVVGATYALANRVLTLFGQDGPFVLEIDRETIELRGLQLAGSNGAASVRGRATSRSVAESMRLTIDAAGSDLTIGEVRADPELEDCGQVGLACRLRNTARSAAAAAVAAGLTGRYKGQLLRTLRPPSPFSFEVGGQSFTLRLAPTRVRATAAGLVVYGKAALE